ncbi:hypothetical protein P175DRAFT_0524218 [Aspergillus ochraceoroseus IBT 24754]|uniref:GP-PDE domain-containing protein n=1 Tax=Aspergillus ochraceoroseus IBT 24754 TaxID=1392256 RepID=A0A2T5LUE3_9EURO|nr:uncharacterized protein P175DRAFT_0524218 [Aspergillus ochraceoroseus IBT 24754]PTU19906.1 hypothetical protein P175DRAFT_0524218 [Aspergillus ochraceoroseus IBT 24754]
MSQSSSQNATGQQHITFGDPLVTARHPRSPPKQGPSSDEITPAPSQRSTGTQTTLRPPAANTRKAYENLPDYCAGVTTQLRITEDYVPFMFHPKTLQDYGNDSRDPETLTWADLQAVHGNAAHVDDINFMRFRDLLQKLLQIQHQHRVLLIDIKSRRHPQDVFGVINHELTNSGQPRAIWRTRLVICIPTDEYIAFCDTHLPGFAVVLNCRSLSYARDIMKNPALIHFKIDREILICQDGTRFVKEASKKNRQLYTEIVNDDNEMKWCIRHQLYGIITDHPRHLDGLYWDLEKNRPPWNRVPTKSLIPRRTRLSRSLVAASSRITDDRSRRAFTKSRFPLSNRTYPAPAPEKEEEEEGGGGGGEADSHAADTSNSEQGGATSGSIGPANTLSSGDASTNTSAKTGPLSSNPLDNNQSSDGPEGSSSARTTTGNHRGTISTPATGGAASSGQ